jgi:pectate lyase
MGHSDNAAAEDKGKLRVTYHHNLFERVSSRLPSIRFGTLHVYSSCYRNNPTSGINVRMGAQALVESTSFINTAKAVVTNLDSNEDGFAVERDNLFASSPVRITRAGSLTKVPYEYVVDAAAVACEVVSKSAGTGIVTF